MAGIDKQEQNLATEMLFGGGGLRAGPGRIGKTQIRTESMILVPKSTMQDPIET